VAVAGTPAYLAPERWRGEPASVASDIYAATAVFVECLTGSPPYLAGDPEELGDLHARAPVPAERVPPPLRPLVERGLAKLAADRPADGSAFLVELAAAASAYRADWEDYGRDILARRAVLAGLGPAGQRPAGPAGTPTAKPPAGPRASAPAGTLAGAPTGAVTSVDAVRRGGWVRRALVGVGATLAVVAVVASCMALASTGNTGSGTPDPPAGARRVNAPPTAGVSGATPPAPPTGSPGRIVTPSAPGTIPGTVLASATVPAPPTGPLTTLRTLRIEFALVSAGTAGTRVTYQVTTRNARPFTLKLAYVSLFAGGRQVPLHAQTIVLSGDTSYRGTYEFRIDTACASGAQQVRVTASTTPDAPGADPQRSLTCPGTKFVDSTRAAAGTARAPAPAAGSLLRSPARIDKVPKRAQVLK
jgi:serine/threonine-protein kinase